MSVVLVCYYDCFLFFSSELNVDIEIAITSKGIADPVTGRAGP
jgi:hypothetical protein